MNDNALSHSARITQVYLCTYGIEGERLRAYPPTSLDLTSIENVWSIIKQNVYADGHNFNSKDTLWAIIKAANVAVQPATIKTRQIS